MRRLVLFFIITGILSSATNIKGQDDSDSTSALLEKLYGRLVNNYDDVSRVRINDSIRVIIDSYVRSDSIFSHRFSNLRYLGQITSSDSVLKIVTWNLVLGNSPGRYYCYIIRKDDKADKKIVYNLTSEYKDATVKSDAIYTAKDWYGALYYDLRFYEVDYKPSWVLLGIDYGNPSVTRKIIEVLSFGPDDSLEFGRNWFVSGGIVTCRAVLEYSANAAMTLRFTSEKSIVFDHLVPFSPSQTGNRQYYGPDYSTDAYYLENGMWRLSVNIDARNKE